MFRDVTHSCTHYWLPPGWSDDERLGWFDTDGFTVGGVGTFEVYTGFVVYRVPRGTYYKISNFGIVRCGERNGVPRCVVA